MSVGPGADLVGGLNVNPLCARCGDKAVRDDATRLQDYPVVGTRPFYPPDAGGEEDEGCGDSPGGCGDKATAGLLADAG